MHAITNKAPIVGYVRYSQKIIFGDKDRNMFEPDYFEYRFNIFINITLKSFQAQTEKNFVMLLFHSVNMPSHYKEKFHKLEKENSFLYNIYVQDTYESFDDAIKNSINYISFENDTAVTFRIDNDDAVQNNFIEKLSFFLKDEFVGNTISMPSNYIVKRIGEKHYKVEERYYPANSIGLANVTTKQDFKSIMEFGQHHLMNDENTMILLARKTNGGLMTINGDNAINTIDNYKAAIIEKEQLNNYLREKNIGNINLECLKIYKEKSKASKISWLNIIHLLTPPLFVKIIYKIKNMNNRKSS